MKRPTLRWHGGKFVLADWIISQLPAHRIYVEPFGGAASVLLKKSRAYAEIYNDLNDDLYNFFLALRDRPEELKRALALTPFSRREFELAHVNHPESIEKARRLIIRSFMGFGSDTASNIERSTGFRSNSSRSGTTPAHDWMNYPEAIDEFAERLKGVTIENRDAFECMQAHDSPETLHYIDPPYVPETRKRVGAYRHEFSLADHAKLLKFLDTLRGSIVLSGYASEIYSTSLKSWVCVKREAMADGARPRTEILWIRASEFALNNNQISQLVFEEGHNEHYPLFP